MESGPPDTRRVVQLTTAPIRGRFGASIDTDRRMRLGIPADRPLPRAAALTHQTMHLPHDLQQQFEDAVGGDAPKAAVRAMYDIMGNLGGSWLKQTRSSLPRPTGHFGTRGKSTVKPRATGSMNSFPAMNRAQAFWSAVPQTALQRPASPDALRIAVSEQSNSAPGRAGAGRRGGRCRRTPRD